jgi:hypothetical protein
VALLRKALLSAVAAEDIAAIAEKLKEKALAGDLAAIKVLFGYVLGKPTPMPDPDQVERQEKDEETRLETLLGRIIMPVLRRGCVSGDDDQPEPATARPPAAAGGSPVGPPVNKPASQGQAGSSSAGGSAAGSQVLAGGNNGPPSPGLARSTNGGSAPPPASRAPGRTTAGRQQTGIPIERLVKEQTPFGPGIDQLDMTILGGR